MVVSALGGITDLLLKSAQQAADGLETYKTSLQEVEQRHLANGKRINSGNTTKQCIEFSKKLCNEIEDICNGIFSTG